MTLSGAGVTMAGSLVPTTVMVTVLAVPSESATGKVSVRVLPSPRLWTMLAALLRV